jgi:hypothetical protein
METTEIRMIVLSTSSTRERQNYLLTSIKTTGGTLFWPKLEREVALANTHSSLASLELVVLVQLLILKCTESEEANFYTD